MSNSKTSPQNLYAALTKEEQDIICRLIHLFLNDAAFEERFHALESEKGRPLSWNETVSFMDRWTGDRPSSHGK